MFNARIRNRVARVILFFSLPSAGWCQDMQFSQSQPPKEATDSSQTKDQPVGQSQSSEPSSSKPTDVYVWGEEPVSTATEANVRQKDFELRPTSTPVDILTSAVPGLYTV